MIHTKRRHLDLRALERQAELFRAMSSPTRIAVMRLLSEHDRNVTEIVAGLSGLAALGSVERTNVSKHLAVLLDAGIVSVSGDAQRRIYHLDAYCLVEALDCVLEGACDASPARNACAATGNCGCSK